MGRIGSVETGEVIISQVFRHVSDGLRTRPIGDRRIKRSSNYTNVERHVGRGQAFDMFEMGER
jgi:hypothetical protein